MGTNRFSVSVFPRAFWFAVLMCAVPVHAQTLYKCTGADGKISFSDRPCPRPAGSGPVRQEERPIARPLTGTERQWALSDAERREMEEGCAKGRKDLCQMLDVIRSRTPAQAMKDLENQARAMCEKGDKVACEAAYCDDPTAKTCLAKTGRASGQGWVESGSRWTQVNGTTTIPVRCAPPSRTGRNFEVYCEPSKKTCYHNQTKEQIVLQRSRDFASLEAAAEDVCNWGVR